MPSKSQHRIRNWKEYNGSLKQRGSITIWFSEDAVSKWHPEPSGNKGRPSVYSDDAILTALMIRFVFHLPLRALEGFLESLVQLTGVDIGVPSYTQICRRAKNLGKVLERLTQNRCVTDLVIDSTGLKVYGEGEWKVRTHGASKRRTWRKLHLAICPDTHEILLAKLTDNRTPDHKVYPEFIHRSPKTVKRVYGDGAYDCADCYRANFDHGSSPIIPPKKNARYKPSVAEYLQERNNSVSEINGLGGDDEARQIWKKLKGYHLRSLVETGMYRFKTLFGGALRSRTLNNQKAEIFAKAKALNLMTRLGMPINETVAA